MSRGILSLNNFLFSVDRSGAAKDRRMLTSSVLFCAHEASGILLTYAILIRGLLRREYRTACMFFRKFIKSGLPLDDAALSADVEALTRIGQPHIVS